MRLDRLKSYALSLPHATVVKQWGETLVFKIGGKMFLIVSLDGDLAETTAFKCTPADYARLTSDVDGIRPASHNLFKAHWVTMEDDAALSENEFKQHIRTSYDLVRAGLPKKIQASLT